MCLVKIVEQFNVSTPKSHSIQQTLLIGASKRALSHNNPLCVLYFCWRTSIVFYEQMGYIIYIAIWFSWPSQYNGLLGFALWSIPVYWCNSFIFLIIKSHSWFGKRLVMQTLSSSNAISCDPPHDYNSVFSFLTLIYKNYPIHSSFNTII